MSEREAFLQGIKDNPKDPHIRKIFADWLDDHDEPEEADFYRNWTLEKYEEAEEWIKDFVEEILEEGEGRERYETELTVESLLAAAHEHLDTGRDTVFLYFDTPDRVRIDSKIFWKHFQILTGRRLAVPDYGEVFFRCGC